jgi:hypothetical protein
MNIGYRMTVYDGPLYYTGSTVLTPASGAPHSEAFKVTTLPSGSVSGYASYMRIPKGSRGSLDPRAGSSTVGQYNVEILDKRTGDANENRWVTAFIGDNNSNLTIIGKKAVIEETLDNGSTWSPFFVGRINDITLTSALTYTISLGDSLEILKQKIFASEPAISYITFKSLIPYGYTRDVSTMDDQSTLALANPLQVATVTRPGLHTDELDLDRWLTLDKTSVNRVDNNWTGGTMVQGNTGRYSGTTYVTITNNSGEQPYRALVLNNGQYYVYKVQMLRTPAGAQVNSSAQKIETILITELSITDPLYAPITAIGLNDKPQIWIYRLIGDDDKISEFFLNETPYNILRDVLRGKFFDKTYTTITSGGTDYYLNKSENIPFNETSIAAMESAYPIGKVLFRMHEPMSAADFIEKQICQPYSLAYTFIPETIDGSIASSFNLFSTAQPTSTTGLSTLDNTNINTATDKEWKTSEPLLLVKGKYYVENMKGGRYAVQKPSTDTLANSTDVLQTLQGTVFYGNLNQINDPSYKILEVDFTSIRGVNSNNATFSNVGLIENTLAADWAKSKALKLAGNIFNRFKSGNPEIQLDCIRNSTTNDIDIGDFVLVNSNILPNQALRTRGGTRIYQVTDKNIDGISINFGLFDSGINATMNTPSFGSFVGTNANAISSSITTTDNANVEIECAIVTQGDAQPSANSTSWLLRTTVNVSSSTKPILLTNLPEGRTVYLRARSFNPDNTDIKLPSAYAYSSGYTLNGIAAPTNVIVSNITNRSATVNWSNTNSFYLTEVLLASPAGVPNTSIIQLPASSSTYTLIGLNENTSTSHTVGVRYVDSFGGFSSMASASFVASGSATKLDAPAALTLYIKR